MIKEVTFAISVLLLVGMTQLIFAGNDTNDVTSYVTLYEDDQKVYHFATEDDINRLKSEIGVRDPGKNYNHLVDGFGTGVAPPSEESWEISENKLVIVDEIKASRDPSLTAVDLSTDPHFPAIGHQGTQGSCGAWAMTYYTYGYLEAKDKGWNQAGMYNNDQLISPAWTYNKVNSGTDGGSWMWYNGYIITDWGAPTLSEMPYDDTNHLSWGNATAFREAPLHRGNQVYYLGHSSSVDDIKTLVDSGIPVTFVIDVYEYNSAFSDGNWIISSTEYDSNTYNHAQTIVGYDDAISDDGETGAFRVANSWGTGWGDSGYYWLTYDAFLEIGGKDLLYLTYMDDIPNYKPSLLATWQFNGAPTRDTDITLGIGPYNSPLATKIPYYIHDSVNDLPTYLSLDITEFQNDFDSGEDRFFLHMGTTNRSGIISSFKLEHYENNYFRGQPTQVSLNSPDVPLNTPGYVTCHLFNHTHIDANKALDNQQLTFTTGGVAGWTGVDHESSDGVSSMQSGDVGDNGVSYIETTITAPVNITWSWKTSADPGDSLIMFIDGALFGSIGGDWDWHDRYVDFTEPNTHVIRWEFRKNSSWSTYEDAAWLDNIRAFNTYDILLMDDIQANNWNFVSTNLIPRDTSLIDILEDPTYGIGGSYDSVMYYNASVGKWATYIPGRNQRFNTLDTWDHTMGIWIRMYVADVLTIRGTVPAYTDIHLYPGWNMVGYPSTQISNNNIPPEVTKVGFFEPTDPYNVAYNYDPMGFIFTPDQGYWLYNSMNYDVIWNVTY
ncbi:MAG: C1 family peptidase [Thermoplasmata archaeon]